MRLKHHHIVSVLIVAFCLLGSCDKCDPFYEIALLSEEEKEFIPYQGFEQLVFTNQYNDTLLMRSKARSSYAEEVRDENQGGGGCPLWGTYLLETDTINFRTHNAGPWNTIKLELLMKIDGYINPGTKSKLYIYINDGSRFFNSTKANPDFDTININGTLYHDVSYHTDEIRDLHYSKEIGIIQFTTEDSTVWTIVP